MPHGVVMGLWKLLVSVWSNHVMGSAASVDCGPSRTWPSG